MNKAIRVFLGLTLMVGLVLSNVGHAQQIDPFYLQRIERGELAFREGNYKKAVEEFNIALFGIQTDHQLKAKAYVYLGMSLFQLNDKEKARTHLEDARDILGMDGLRELIADDSVWFYLNRSMVELELMEPETKLPGDTAAPTKKPVTTTIGSPNPRHRRGPQTAIKIEFGRS